MRSLRTGRLSRLISAQGVISSKHFQKRSPMRAIRHCTASNRLVTLAAYATVLSSCFLRCQGMAQGNERERLKSLFPDSATTYAYDYPNGEDEYNAYSSALPFSPGPESGEQRTTDEWATTRRPRHKLCDPGIDEPKNDSDLVW